LRSFGGITSEPIVGLYSGAWYNTTALTSITLDQIIGTNFVSGSRFSLYGLKARS
jgi:hypothetical protein